VQVYRLLDIGSGKPPIDVRERIPHHLIDIVSPDYHFTAGDFCVRADEACADIAGRGRVPLFVGGTGLYISSFFFGLSDIPPVASAVKEQVAHDIAAHGLASMYDELAACDPLFAARIHPNDRQRIARGLEVYRGLGRPLSGFYATRNARVSDDTLFVGLSVERQPLRERISARVGRMMADGFLDEVERLRALGYGSSLNSMRSIGYAQLNEHLDGACGLDDAVGRIIIATAHYAKRQMTWFGRMPQVRWFSGEDQDGVRRCVDDWLQRAGPAG